MIIRRGGRSCRGCITLVILQRGFPLETDKAIPERALPLPEKISSFESYEREVFVQNAAQSLGDIDSDMMNIIKKWTKDDHRYTIPKKTPSWSLLRS